MKHLLFFVFLFQSLFLSAQNRPVDLVKMNRNSWTELSYDLLTLNTTTRNSEIPVECKNPVLFHLNKNILQEVLRSSEKSIKLTLPSENRNDIILNLIEVNIQENAFVMVEPGYKKVNVTQGRHYRGIIEGDESSLAAISIFDNEILGFISSPKLTGNLVLGKMETSDTHILYEDEDIMEKLHFTCGVADENQNYTAEELKGQKTEDRTVKCTRLYIEVDYDIYTGKGSSLTAVNNFVTGIFNQVGALYANENLTTTLSEIVVWTQASPYNSTTSIGMLNAFTAHRQGFNGDLAQLISYKASGGVAYVNGFCRSNPDLSMSFASIHSTYSNVPAYSWTVEVCAHEFGHLFGSQHTHACAWNGNNTAIDGCYTTEGGCANPGLPSGGGTVMSYCHLTSVGINFSNGFGLQPGNVMRSRVSTASCLGNCEGGGNQCTSNQVRLTIKVDSYPHETTWNLKNSSNVVIYSGGPYTGANTIKTEDFCLENGCYTFTIFDSYGDGICCTYGQGYYNVKKGDVVLGSGGQFTSSHVQTFCVSTNPTPTCTDGVQNGQETGIDCGGPTCPPCASCTDGIQNGQETGVDCGGPICPACATCSDGIQNGQETGVDCGGPTCPPCASCTDGIRNGQETGVDCGGPICPACATCSDGIQNGLETGVDCGGPNCPPCNGTVVETNLGGYYFETGWDGWTKGGSYASRYSGSLSPEGQFSIRISFNQQVSSSFSSPNLNLATLDSVKIQFLFFTQSVETGERFELQYFNGSLWITLASYISGTHFVNNTDYSRTFKLSSNLVNNAKFRFMAFGSDSYDRIYIDAVQIRGFDTVSGATCTDGIQNGQETGVDCGGPTCPACPTCNDGIQNGQETGVDCGGPNCPACPTCNDGIQNGQETGVDCGGPVCPACPTCNDGIQNGQETGIDCGGPICQPCNIGNQTQIGGYYFESGWDGWLDGGTHCFRYGGSFSPEGTYSIRMRSNGAESATTSPVYNLTTFQAIAVEFRFKASGMENGKSFVLQYFNGSAYTTVATFTAGAEFANNITYLTTVNLSGSFASNGRFRFMNQATDNTDYIFIDAIVITGFTGSSLLEGVKFIDVLHADHETFEEVDLIVYPNPVDNELQYNITDVPARIKIYDTKGKLISDRWVYDPNGKIDVSDLNSGMFLIIAETPNDVINKKFIKN
ncbi:MAG: T9SS type A sorting domain-containing protein [Saprospiraceae bacterium]|nr:T9SS type A sorting domain-containing protein [Saprospiraceae bacterium]